MKNKFWTFLGAIVLVEVLGSIGTIFTGPSIGGWYSTIVKPSFNPPNWIFGPVWSTLFLLMGIALAIVYRSTTTSENAKNKKLAFKIFFVQMLFNIAWSYFFFYLHSPVYAFVEMVMLWILIALNIYYFSKVNKTAAWLLVPYILWVSFAAFLNFSIIGLN